MCMEEGCVWGSVLGGGGGSMWRRGGGKRGASDTDTSLCSPLPPSPGVVYGAGRAGSRAVYQHTAHFPVCSSLRVWTIVPRHLKRYSIIF